MSLATQAGPSPLYSVQPQRHTTAGRLRISPKIEHFRVIRLASRLLLIGVSGGFSGPASRSGVPLEHPPCHTLPAWLQGESKDTPCPAMYSR